MATLVNLIVHDIKVSKSGKSDVISLYRKIEQPTALGTNFRTIWYNTFVANGTSELKPKQEIELNLDEFDIELSTLDDGNISRWLMPKQ